MEVSQRDPAQAGSHWPLACTAKKPVSTGSTRVRVSEYKRCGAITLDTLVLWRHPSPVLLRAATSLSNVREAPEPLNRVQRTELKDGSEENKKRKTAGRGKKYREGGKSNKEMGKGWGGSPNPHGAAGTEGTKAHRGNTTGLGATGQPARRTKTCRQYRRSCHPLRGSGVMRVDTRQRGWEI